MSGSFPIIDAHAHCGRRDRFPPQDLSDYMSHLGRSGIRAVIMFPPVSEIYDRYDPGFKDTDQWRSRRRESNDYLLGLSGSELTVYPFLFIWNDYAVDQITSSHKGIKWHRHPDEPRYDYGNSLCHAAIAEIRRRNMPVCLEEEFENTMHFINEIAKGVKVVIPHLGLLNGGYERLRRLDIWAMPNVYADTALAPPNDISDYVSKYGHERIMFGSDFPFGDPVHELNKVMRLNLTAEQRAAITALNAAKLLAESNI
ncbi:MAG: amidohydrolase family protein [Syntrophobacteraceae bacterium]|nr:amidohydrolase family protein [Syntrophobacteraceae bacterium]